MVTWGRFQAAFFVGPVVIAGGLIHFFPGSKRKQLMVWPSGEGFILLPDELNCVGLGTVCPLNASVS